MGSHPEPISRLHFSSLCSYSLQYWLRDWYRATPGLFETGPSVTYITVGLGTRTRTKQKSKLFYINTKTAPMLTELKNS